MISSAVLTMRPAPPTASTWRESFKTVSQSHHPRGSKIIKYLQLVRRSVWAAVAPADRPLPITSQAGRTPATWPAPPTPTATPTRGWCRGCRGLLTPRAPGTTRCPRLPTSSLTRTHSARWVTVHRQANSFAELKSVRILSEFRLDFRAEIPLTSLMSASRNVEASDYPLSRIIQIHISGGEHRGKW